MEAGVRGSVGVYTTEDGRQFSIFPDYQTGWNAMLNQLQSSKYLYSSIHDMAYQWAPIEKKCPPGTTPPPDHEGPCNDPATYSKNLAAKVGVSENKLVGDMTPNELLALASAIEDQEGWQPNLNGVSVTKDPSCP